MSGSRKDSSASKRSIQVKALARVEGEGALHLVMSGDQVEELQLKIYEPPRFFEAFLRGRDFREVPDITARICGICPVAYQMGSCHALEKAMGVFDQVDPAIRTLRNVLYCGEWIESHVLHMFLLHLPDFLGFESAISMAADHSTIVKRALRVKKAGNDILALVAGRAVHPVGVCVGGFYRAPDQPAAARLAVELRACLEDMSDLTMFLAEKIKFPALERDYEFVALCPDDEYPMNLGRIKSNKGLNVDQEEFGRAIEELHVSHCNSLHSIVRDRGPYMVGPLARLNLNADKLQPRAAELLPRVCHAISRHLPWRDNYLSLLARSLETVHALELAANLLTSYTLPGRPRVPIVPRAGIGGHGTEAPRGLCWHEYRTDADGTIVSARIIPPTSQNYATIEADLRALAPQIVALPDEEATLCCEHVIRNYDPCISCSVHFLKLDRTRCSPSR
jgi:coenzyme F420-reducing hydrogenase alpha subunit